MLADQNPAVDQFLDRLAHGLARDTQALAKRNLALEPVPDTEDIMSYRVPDVLRNPRLQRRRIRPVKLEGWQRGAHRCRSPSRHV